MDNHIVDIVGLSSNCKKLKLLERFLKLKIQFIIYELSKFITFYL